MAAGVILAIDPGPDESAWCIYSGTGPMEWGKEPNGSLHVPDYGYAEIVIEMVASYGMPVGAEIFETCVMIGRLLAGHARYGPLGRLTRAMVKLHICKNSRANDATIRQAILDRYGGKERAIGKKKTPGPLYGLHGDCWAALALAITAAETTERYHWPPKDKP